MTFIIIRANKTVTYLLRRRDDTRLLARVSVLALLLFAPNVSTAESTIKVVASILPLHSLAAGVMDGVAEPELLVPGDADVHSFALKPSTRRLIDNADLIFYMGPQFETYLTRVIAEGSTNSVALLSDKDVRGVVSDSIFQAEENFDPHIWLDPVYAAAVVRSMVRELGRVDPLNKSTYQSNGQKLVARIEKLRQAIDEQLTPIRDKRFIVYHNAYTHFQSRFGLGAVSFATNNESLSPGARRVKELTHTAKAVDVKCFFVEPGPYAAIGRIHRGTDRRTSANLRSCRSPIPSQ